MSPARKSQDTLSGVAKILTVVLVVCLGLWGCARNPGGHAGSGERVRALESRCQKLEQDHRAVAQARDKARKELAALEDETGRLQKELAEKAALAREREQQFKAGQSEREELNRALAQRTGERDDLRQQLAQRQSERDLLLGRCEKFRRGLQNLLTEDDNPAPTMPPAGPVPTPSAVSGGPSLNGES